VPEARCDTPQAVNQQIVMFGEWRAAIPAAATPLVWTSGSRNFCISVYPLVSEGKVPVARE